MLRLRYLKKEIESVMIDTTTNGYGGWYKVCKNGKIVNVYEPLIVVVPDLKRRNKAKQELQNISMEGSSCFTRLIARSILNNCNNKM